VLPLHEIGAHHDALVEAGAAHVAQLHVDDRPGIACFAHLLVVVADALEQRTAGDLEVLDVMAVPDHVHGVDVEERHEDLDLGLQYAVLTHRTSTSGYGSAQGTGAVRLPARGLRSAAGSPRPVRRAWLQGP